MALTTNSHHTQLKVLSTHIKISTYFSDKIVMSASVIACLRGYHLQNNSRDKIKIPALLEAAFYYIQPMGLGVFNWWVTTPQRRRSQELVLQWSRSSLWKHYLSIIMSDNLCILQGNPVLGQGIEDYQMK